MLRSYGGLSFSVPRPLASALERNMALGATPHTSRSKKSLDSDDENELSYDWGPASADMEDSSQVVPMGAGEELPSHFFSRKSLQDPSFQYDSLFEKLVNGAGITRPSRIQSMAWPVLAKGQHALIADQTGSGKTLAYLVPLLRKALSAKQPNEPRLKGAPRLLVLVPTVELAEQLKAVCHQLATGLKFSSMVLTATSGSGTNIHDQIRMIQRENIDVIIATPGRIATILRTKNSGLNLSELQSIVLDEVDVLMADETFGPQLRAIGAVAPVDRVQFVFVTATLPDSVVDTITQEFPNVEQVRGPGLHRVAPTMHEILVDVSVPPKYNTDEAYCFDLKAQELLKTLRQTRCRRTLIFCNTVESCRKVENFLKRRDRKGYTFDVRAYHGAMTPEARNENLRVFSKGRRGKANNVDYILVCTDRAARGQDFDTSPVDHVVVFDFPRDPAEYVRRVGRTARAGRKGTCSVFAYGWQLPIARNVMGSKLNEFSATLLGHDTDTSSTDSSSVEYRGGAQRRRTVLPDPIKQKIESGTLWKD